MTWQHGSLRSKKSSTCLCPSWHLMLSLGLLPWVSGAACPEVLVKRVFLEMALSDIGFFLESLFPKKGRFDNFLPRPLPQSSVSVTQIVFDKNFHFLFIFSKTQKTPVDIVFSRFDFQTRFKHWWSSRFFFPECGGQEVSDNCSKCRSCSFVAHLIHATSRTCARSWALFLSGICKRGRQKGVSLICSDLF